MINFYNNIKSKINFKKIISIIKETIIIGIISIIGTYALTLSIIVYKTYDERTNDKEITIEDKTIIDKELDAKGKDIIIILDFFNKQNEWHGNDVSSYFKSYFKYDLKKEIDIKIINLSFKEQTDKNNFNNIGYLDLLEYNDNRLDRYQEINKESYSLETYIKRIRELNPNSKIVLSLSWIRQCTNDIIISLSKEYDYKIAQAYYNPYKYESIYTIPFNIIYFYFLANYDNTILVSTQNTKPLWYLKQISLDDIKHNKDLEDNVDWSTSYLTPVLGYEYYLNKDSNIINKKKENKMEKYLELYNSTKKDFNLRYIGEFESYHEYLHKHYGKYSLAEELELNFVFSELELKELKAEIKEYLEDNINNEKNIYYGFYNNGTLLALELESYSYSSKKEFEHSFYLNDNGEFDDIIFYADSDKLKYITKEIDKYLDMINMTIKEKDDLDDYLNCFHSNVENTNEKIK